MDEQDTRQNTEVKKSVVQSVLLSVKTNARGSFETQFFFFFSLSLRQQFCFCIEMPRISRGRTPTRGFAPGPHRGP